MAEGGAITLPWGDKIAFNYKCIVISVGLALLYWFAPSKNKWVLASILYLTYLAISWYDYLFGCATNPLRPTFLYSFYGFLKPREYRQAYATWQQQTKELVFLVDLLIVLLLMLALPAVLRWRPGC